MSSDFLDLEIDSLYFDAPIPARAEALIKEASECYGSIEAELQLLRAYLLAPENLTVIVALYRYYYYQHRLEDALVIAQRALDVSGRAIYLSPNWEAITAHDVAGGAFKSVGLVRFYLLAIKALGVVRLRLGDIEGGKEAIRKVCTLDPQDRLKTKEFLAMIEEVSDNSAAASSCDDVAVAVSA